MKKMLKFCIMLIVLAFLHGCQSSSFQPNVETTQPWEGRYSTQKEAVEAIDKEIQIDDGQSIWILQSSTLSRLLRNVGK